MYLGFHRGLIHAAQRAAVRSRGIQSAAGARPAADERARIAAIVGAPEAKGREQIANHLAFETDLSAERAVAALKASPIGPAPLPKNPTDREADADRLAALDAAVDRQIAKHRPAPLSSDAGQRALLEGELRASSADSADASLRKAIGRELLRQYGVAKAGEYLKRAAGDRANSAGAEPRSGRVLAAAPRR